MSSRCRSPPSSPPACIQGRPSWGKESAKNAGAIRQLAFFFCGERTGRYGQRFCVGPCVHKSMGSFGEDEGKLAGEVAVRRLVHAEHSICCHGFVLDGSVRATAPSAEGDGFGRWMGNPQAIVVTLGALTLLIILPRSAPQSVSSYSGR